MRKTVLIAALAASVLAPVAASAQVIDPRMSRDIGRAVGEATVAAERAAEDARIAAREAIREARRGYAQGSGRGAGTGTGYGYDDRRFDIRSEDDAIDACVVAAEQEGHSRSRVAAVRDIMDVERYRDGWDVIGVLETRDSWRAERRDPATFRCTVRQGEIADLRFNDSWR